MSKKEKKPAKEKKTTKKTTKKEKASKPKKETKAKRTKEEEPEEVETELEEETAEPSTPARLEAEAEEEAPASGKKTAEVETVGSEEEAEGKGTSVEEEEEEVEAPAAEEEAAEKPEEEEEEGLEIVEEKFYDLNLRRIWNTPRVKRTPRAVRYIREFVSRRMKSDQVSVSEETNHLLWARGIKKPPRHVRLRVVKDKEDRVIIFPAESMMREGQSRSEPSSIEEPAAKEPDTIASATAAEEE